MEGSTVNDDVPADSGRLILMNDPSVTGVPVEECGEPLVDLGLDANFIIDDRLADAAGAHRLVRLGLAERLTRAAHQLPGGLRLLVIEGFRPLVLQAEYFRAYQERLHAAYPERSDDEIYSLASQYVAPPFDVPPHCCGAAIDLTLALKNGRELDMGTRVNESPEESRGRCYTDSPHITPEAASNRAILSSALREVGLVNYPTEWWHWSYGDRYWSFKTASPTAIYGLIETS